MSYSITTNTRQPSTNSIFASPWTQSPIHKLVGGFGEQYIFKFSNRFKKDSQIYWKFCCIPAIPGKGLCGGMALAVKTYFTHHKPAPQIDYPDDKLLEFIAKCQLDTLTFSALFKYFAYMLTSQEQDRQTVRKAWPEIKESIDQDKLIIIGLIFQKTRCLMFFPGVFKNHQVLVYGYEIENGTVYLRLYDPKHPQEVNTNVSFKEDGSNLDCSDSLKQLFKPEDDLTKEPELLPEKRKIYTFFPVYCDASKETLQYFHIQKGI